MKEFLKRKNIEISLKRYGIDALGAMAQGLFCSLLIGTIINTIGSICHLSFLTAPVAVISGIEYTVVGIIDEDEDSSLFSQILIGGKSDGTVYLPYTSAKKLLGTSTVSTLEVYVTDPDETDAAIEEMEAVLDAIFNYKDDTYTIINMESMTEAMNLMTSMMMSLLVGIASIALVVGGIGIMNMMLVTVTERTTEIGLRKALGAEPGQIQVQFLLEAIILSLMGGLIGVIVGLGISYAICLNTDVTFSLNTFAIGLGVSFSAAVGIIFGWAPARKASNLNPIDALRSM